MSGRTWIPDGLFRKIMETVPMLCVDGILFEKGRLLLIRRACPPYKGEWCLPGGFVLYGESTEEAVVREFEEETGLKTRVMRLVGVYSDPERDPIGHKVSVCYLVKRTGGRECKSRETKEITFFDLKKLPRLGFDHEKMIRDALKRN